MSDGPSLAVVIPTYRGADMTIRCLDSLREACAPLGDAVEVAVVDDGSGDASGERIRRAHPWVLVVERETNGGYPAAINAGLRATTASWILTLNNDTRVDPRALVEIVSYAASAAPDVGSLAAQQRFAKRPDTIYSAGITLDRIGVNADRLIGRPASEGEREPTEVFGASGGAAVYSRKLIDDIGELDEGFEFGLEDADFAWRARMRGWRCMYLPSAVIFHDVGGTVPYGSERRFLQAGRNRIRLVVKNADRRMLVRYGLLMIAYDLAYVVAAAARYRTAAPLRGRWHSVRRWRAIRAAGRPGRRAVPLAPVMGIRAALERRTNLIR